MMSTIIEEIIVRSIQKTITREEQEILNLWLKEDKENIEFYFQLEEIWNFNKKLSEEHIQQGFNRLFEEIIEHPQEKISINSLRKKQKPLWIFYAAAMLVGILIGSSVWGLFKSSDKASSHLVVQNTIYNKSGVEAITLPDSSVIWLNEESKLSYPEAFSSGRRVVSLEGKAYFNINKDAEKPFIVKLNNVEVEVTGTQFFIDHNNTTEAIVTLISGGVNLNYNKNEEAFSTFIRPGEQFRFNSVENIATVEEVDTEFYVAWKDGTYRFNDQPLEKITSILSKYFELNIEVAPSLKQKRFTGRVMPNENIEDVLELFRNSYPVKYEKTKDRIYITE